MRLPGHRPPIVNTNRQTLPYPHRRRSAAARPLAWRGAKRKIDANSPSRARVMGVLLQCRSGDRCIIADNRSQADRSKKLTQFRPIAAASLSAIVPKNRRKSPQARRGGKREARIERASGVIILHGPVRSLLRSTDRGPAALRLAERMRNVHPKDMGWLPILSLSCLVREGLRARVVCPSCLRVVILDPRELRERHWRVRGGDQLSDVARLLRCRACHHRGAMIKPSTLPATRSHEHQPAVDGPVDPHADR